MKAYVVGVNVDNSGDIGRYLPIIEKYHVALVYYDESSPILQQFKNIRKGDLIIIGKGSNRYKECFFAGLAESECKGAFYDEDGEEYGNYHIKLNPFISLKDKKIPFSENNAYGEATQVPGVYELKWKENPYDKEVVELVKKILGESAKKDMINNIKRLLLSNKNLVLTGAPGTGKTYMANNIAADIIFSGNVPENFEDCDEFKERRGFVQFHPSYDYTDFVEGIRPVENQGFERRDGIFKKFCKKALKNLIDSKKDTYALTFENVVYRYLIEFISDIEERIENDGKFNIKGFRGKDVAPICCIEFSDYEKVLSFSVDTDKCSIRIKKYVSKWIELYDMFINIDDFKNIKCKDFQEKLGIAGSRTYHYGFLIAFYDAYGDKIKEALKNTVNKVEEKEYVFIIDEINRGDLNKILGELFFAVDSGYRGKKGLVNTQYQNLIDDGDEFKNGFFIPDNVYIIGTMNDIDRSVESMDFALRRRFVWKEIKAEDTQCMLDIFDSITELHNKGISSQKVKDKMNALNKSIESIKGFNRSYHIGASYFLKLQNYKDEENPYETLWENHLEPLIKEYLRGYDDTEDDITRLKEAYDKGTL